MAQPISHTPTEPVDYAVLTAAYGSLLGALVLAVGSGRASEPVQPGEIVPLGVATFALSKAIAHEKVETWLRQPFVDEQPEGESRPKGMGLRYAVGELLTCTRCLGVWSSLALVALRTTSPAAGRTVVGVLGASAVNDFMQAGFRWVCSKSSEAEA